jgi:hypothetical protein
MLREIDKQWLEAQGYRFSIYVEGSNNLLVIQNYVLPPGFDPQTVELLLVVPSTYPDGQLDMWWIHPPVVFAQTRVEPANAQVRQAFPGYAPEPSRQWQRFSRHPQWRAGVDDLRSYLRALQSTLANEARRIAA